MAKRQHLVTLLTDFGRQDAYAAAMKGVILRICPAAQIVDISHDVPAHDVLAGAFILAQAAPYFPPGAVHVVVVDPGVGTDRRILAGRFGGHIYLFPDNGVITLIAERAVLEALVVVRNIGLLPGQEASMTFHGRDIFAPLAGHILNGLGIERLGPPPDTYKLLDLPAPEVSGQQIVGQVVYVDAFGNLVTNVSEELVRAHWPDPERVRAACAGHDAGPLLPAYGFAGEGQPLVLFNSMGMVELAVNRGRASDAFHAAVGTIVRLTVDA